MYNRESVVFLHDWKNVSDLVSEFDLKDGDLSGVRILLASYELDGYEGTAYVLFERDGKLYEVHGSHCSCYGLEGQWEPEETTKESVWFRLSQGDLGKGYYGNVFAEELTRILEEMESASD